MGHILYLGKTLNSYLSYKYKLNTNEVNKCWIKECHEQKELLRLCEQVKELCMLRDSPHDDVLTRYEAQEIINVLCTE